MLAAGDYMVVEQCTCGSVHVTIGAVTLRLAESALPSLAGTLTEAARSVAFDRMFPRRPASGEVLS
jgi:hypothetical protein